MEDKDRIRAERERQKLSQKALGDLVGVSQPAIKKIESGETRKSKYIPDLLQALGLPINPATSGAASRPRGSTSIVISESTLKRVLRDTLKDRFHVRDAGRAAQILVELIKYEELHRDDESE